MAVQLSIPYETLVELVDQLDAEQKRQLVAHLSEGAQSRKLTAEEKISISRSMTLNLGPISPNFSDRREDWYGDDGR